MIVFLVFLCGWLYFFREPVFVLNQFFLDHGVAEVVLVEKINRHAYELFLEKKVFEENLAVRGGGVLPGDWGGFWAFKCELEYDEGVNACCSALDDRLDDAERGLVAGVLG